MRKPLPILALLLAVVPSAWGTFPATDNFNRASLGSNWTQDTFSNGTCTIVSSTKFGSDGGDTYAVCYWNPDTPGTVASSAIQLTKRGPAYSGACLALDGESDGICCLPTNNYDAAHTWEMQFLIPESIPGNIGGGGNSPVFNAGDWIGIQRTDATHFQCVYSTDGTTWTLLGSSQSIGGASGGFAGAVTNGVSGGDEFVGGAEPAGYGYG